MKKKKYIAPQMEVVDLDVVTMLATSKNVGVFDTTTDADAVMSNRHRGTWGNLWAKDEE